MSTTSSKNFTTLYSGSGSVTPQAPYGNANVVGLLSVGTDGANTVGNISATGNVTAAYFIGNGSQLTGIASSYGNANVAALLASGSLTSNVITTGNVQGAYILGNGSQLTGLPATYGNANVAAYLPTYTGNLNPGNVAVTANLSAGNISTAGTITAVGNVTTAGYFVGNFAGNISGNITVPGSNTQVLFNSSGNVGASGDFTFNDSTNVLSVAGNINATNFAGSGAGLTSLTGANVTGVVAQATQAATANVANSVAGANVSGVVAQATQAATANVANSVAGANVSGVVAQATQANAANTAVTVTGAAQANITSVGTLTSLNASGNITSSGNISGNFILGNGSQLTGLPDTYSNANVTSLLAAFGSNTISTTGNVTAGNVSAGIITATGNITSSANIAGSYFLGNGAFLTGISGGGSYSNANVAAYLPTYSGNIGNTNIGPLYVGSVTGITRLILGAAGDWYLVGTSDALISSGQTEITLGTGDSINGNIKFTTQKTGNVFTWDFDGLGNLTLPPNVATPVIQAGNAVVTFNSASGNINVPALVASGNINGANLVAAANLTSTQQTVIGTANVGTTGNIVISGKNIATDMAFLPDGGNAATAVNSRVVVGTGWNGNISHSVQQQRLLISDSFNRANTATNVRLLAAEPFVTLTANVTNGSTRNQALGGYMRIGGGSAGNTTALSTNAGSIFSVSAGQFNLDIGNISPYNLGNTSISHAALNGGAMAIVPGSSLTNGYGVFTNIAGAPGAGTSGNLVNYIGYSTNLAMSTVPTGNIYSFYHGSNTTGTITGAGTTNFMRQAPQYYAFYNADDLAQIQLGSLRRYHEFETATATSGSFAIDKNVAQVHNIVPTGNCTITGYSNMVTSVSDSVTSDAQVDTLTIIIEQGTTPYTITMPTGAAFKYAGGITTVGATANAVTMISVTAANVRGTTTYLTTISPEFL